MSVLYRIHHRLLLNIAHGRYLQRGCVHPLGTIRPDVIALLLAQGAISVVHAPTLDAFTGWKGREKKLSELGIDTIGFVTMEPRDIAYAIKATTRNPDTDQETFDERVDKLAIAVERWQHEIKEALGIGDATGRR